MVLERRLSASEPRRLRPAHHTVSRCSSVSTWRLAVSFSRPSSQRCSVGGRSGLPGRWGRQRLFAGTVTWCRRGPPARSTSLTLPEAARAAAPGARKRVILGLLASGTSTALRWPTGGQTAANTAREARPMCRATTGRSGCGAPPLLRVCMSPPRPASSAMSSTGRLASAARIASPAGPKTGQCFYPCPARRDSCGGFAAVAPLSARDGGVTGERRCWGR